MYMGNSKQDNVFYPSPLMIGQNYLKSAIMKNAFTADAD
jgi:hypothetical protein